MRFDDNFFFSQGVDDVASECDLDNFDDWDYVINNDAASNAEAVFHDINAKLDDVLKKT